jgi:signal transduction histidine kinase
MIATARALVRRHWPRLRLRTILFGTLFFVAALPGVGAVFLRVYENTLVRQTGAELVAQGAALAAAAEALWPGTPWPPITHTAIDEADNPYSPARQDPIDLSSTPILAERPPPAPAVGAPEAAAEELAERTEPIIERTEASTLAAILFLDDHGRIVTGPDAGRSYAALPEVQAALAGQPNTVLRRNGAYRQVYRFEWLTRAAAIRVHHARPIFVGKRVVGVLLLSRSSRALFRGLYEDRGKIASGVAAIFLILLGLAALLSRGIARPIERLSLATRTVAAGRGDVPPVPETAAIEIQALYADFAAMADAIERRSRYLRDFAHAVSHEFKTPLAGISGGIELLADHMDTMSADERGGFLSNIAADAARLDRLVSRLLDLARADMARDENGVSADCLSVMRRVADAYSGRSVGVVASATEPMPVISMPAEALETCLTALVENAAQAGANRIRIDARSDKGGVAIDIVDDGPGIAFADRERIFTPFFTTRRDQGGTGLGLSIVVSLLSAYGNNVALFPSERGTIFRIRLH